MKRAVRWTDQADQQLAAIWIAASDRDEVTAAANRIEAALRRDPLAVGESRGHDDRILFDSPLVIY